MESRRREVYARPKACVIHRGHVGDAVTSRRQFVADSVGVLQRDDLERARAFCISPAERDKQSAREREHVATRGAHLTVNDLTNLMN